MVRSDAELARLLGVDRSAVCRMKRRGMPTDSLEAAQAWRAANLSPAHRKDLNPARSGVRAETAAAAVERMARVLPIAEAAVRSGALHVVEPELRAAWAALPELEQERVLMSVELWDALCLDHLVAQAGARGGHR